MKQKRRIISLVMASLLMFSMTATALPPLEMTDMTEALYRSNVITPILSASLSHSFEDAVIANESTWIPLHDTEGTEYAYFVPLCNEKGMITGFSVIGNINGNHSTLFNRNNTMPDEFAMAVISAYQNRNTGDKMIYSFPYAFIIGQEGSYKRVYANGTIESVTDIQQYETNAATRLATTPYEIQDVQLDADADNVYAMLDHWAVHDFVPIVDTLNNDYIYYGGSQNWLANVGYSQDVFQACGLTAAANTFHYMSQYVSGKSALYSRLNLTKTDFSYFQKDLKDNAFIFDDVIPGIPSVYKMEEYVGNWARYRGVSMTAAKSANGWSKTQYRSHIITGLNSERPVMLLTGFSPIERLEHHWVTITKFYSPAHSLTENIIVVSNMGAKEEHSFDQWYSTSSANYKGTIYFN
ncbi:MAG: hypothetical protein E7432_07665 [Ruminococcaceae bacterium]|nr:hypothetical protein [Oscillospiraceae bacterium]